jgi:membrane fusion protein (multidrug efflux system)
MLRTFIVSLLGIGILAGVACQKSMPAPQPPPPEVSVVPVVQQDVTTYGEWVATLDGYQNAQIQPQVTGYLLKQNYKEGSFVHKDDVLFEIDPRVFQATLDQAKSQLAQAHGQVAQTKAQLQLADINVKRDTPLAAAHAIAQSQLDNDLQTKAQQEAALETAQATVQAAEAAIASAELNLNFTKVRSLLDGIAGITTTQIGNLVSPTTVLTTVSQVNPIKAYFPISESEYLQVANAGKGSSDWLRASSAVPLQLTLTNGTVYPQTGHIVFADRQVDSQTGTIRIAGAFANPNNLLRPGQFGRIRARTGVDRGALLVPQRAITQLQGRYQVAVVGPNNRVSIRSVTVGERVGALWAIKSGVSAGERVVTEGLAKVAEGSPVNPQPDKNTNSNAGEGL